MLEIRNLSVRYGDVQALKNINLRINSGFTAIVGPNGSGKSTLLKALAGLVKYEGRILFNGRPFSTLDPVMRRKLITYIPPYASAMPDMNIGDVLLVGEGVRHEKLDYYVDLFDLSPLLRRRVWEVSSGELQRALIARGLSRDSTIYGVDEPISHTDVKYQLRILKELRSISSGNKHVLVASNQLNPVLNFADEVIALRGGNLYFFGRVSDFISEEVIRGLYGIKVKVVRVNSLIDVIPAID